MDILIIGILAALLQAALAVAFLWRKQMRRFPCFFAYTVFSVAAIAVTVALRRSANAYFFASIATELGYGTLALLAIREAYRHALDSYYIRLPWSRFVPPLLLVVVIAVTGCGCAYHPQIRGAAFTACLYSGTAAFQLAIAAVEVLMLGTLVYLAWVKLYQWRRYNRVILTGFGVYGSVTLVSSVLRDMLHLPFESPVRYLAPGAYFGATLLWLVAFLSQRDVPIKKRPPDEQKLDDLHTTLETYIDDFERHRDNS